MTRFPLLGALASGALVLATSVACTSETYDAVPVDALYAPFGQPPVVVSNGDETLELTTMSVAFGLTRLIECEDDEGLSATRALRQWLADTMLPTANAHSPSTPTSSGTPVVLQLHTDRDVMVASALRPVRGARFCAVTILVEPADEDARGLERAPEMLNRSVSATGLLNGEPFQASVTARFERTLVLDPPLVADESVTLVIDANIERVAAAFMDVSSSTELNERLLRAALLGLEARADR